MRHEDWKGWHKYASTPIDCGTDYTSVTGWWISRTETRIRI